METKTNQNPVPQDASKPSGGREVGAFFTDLVKIFLLALVIIIPFRIFIAEPFVVSGSSMLPNFHNKDYLIIDRLSYHTRQVERGDVVVLKYPKDTSQYFIKRIVGLPGETVAFREGHVIIYNQEHPDGWQLQEPYLPSQVETIGSAEPVTLAEGQYFALGDNRMASSDSRIWGILPQDDIVGRVWLRIFPMSRFGGVEEPAYAG